MHTYDFKRENFRFCEKISYGLHKPIQKFVTDMVYGLLAGRSCLLTKIARELKESIALDKTVERLSRNLMNSDGSDALSEQYFQAVGKHFDDSTVLLIDDSDISKPCGSKLEALCPVRDGSTGEIAEGYWYAGVSALTANHKQPIPVYSRIYSSLKEDYISNNHETLKSFSFLSSHFPKTTICALDRGYDAGYVFDYFVPQQEAFITRMNDRKVLHKGEKILLSKIAKRFKSKYALKVEAQNGKKADCKMSIVPVSLPNYPDETLNLIICMDLGREPMLLLTNLSSDDKRLCVTIVKVYLMRGRIEEYYKFKKQGFGFEKFLGRSLKSIRNLDLLLTITTGYIGVLSEKIDHNIQVIEIIEASK